MSTFLRGPLFLVLISCFANPVYAADLKPVENQAKMEFSGKNLLMSHPYVKNKLHFNASGALVRGL